MKYDEWMRPERRVRRFLAVLPTIYVLRESSLISSVASRISAISPRTRASEEFRALIEISRSELQSQFSAARGKRGRKRIGPERWLRMIREEKDWVRKNMLFVAYFTYRLRQVGLPPPIVTGGVAAMIYAPAWITTEDIDLIVSDRERAGSILMELGFTREQRIWYNEKLGLAVKMPSDILTGSMDKVRRFEIEGLEFYLIGVEDLTIQRLVIGKHWGDRSGIEAAAALLTIHLGSIDMAYLEERAREQRVDDILRELTKRAVRSE